MDLFPDILSDDEGFDIFYRAYPHKKDPGHARIAFRRFARFLPEMLQAIEEQKAERIEKIRRKVFVAPWKYPATWLNGECWKDEIEFKPIEPPPKCANCPHAPHDGTCSYCEAVAKQNGKPFGCSHRG